MKHMKFMKHKRTKYIKPIESSESEVLGQLAIGEYGRLVKIPDGHHLSQRLRDLGWFPGEMVRCLYGAPLGTLRAYQTTGVTVALRQDDAMHIFIQREGGMS